jgi:superoxide reductase
VEGDLKMTNRAEIYKCGICGNIVEVLHTGDGQLVCCGQPMTLLDPKTEDEGQEKHVPVIEKTETGIKVKVGSIQHPMEEAHYIEFIEAMSDDVILRKYLNPGDLPEAEFKGLDENVTVREHCTVHGLWKSK